MTERIRSSYSVAQSSSDASAMSGTTVRTAASPRSSTFFSRMAAAIFGRNSFATLSCTKRVSIALQTAGRDVFAFSAMRSAMSRSALSSTNVWQIPAPVSMTGTALSVTTRWISPAPPRGMIKSRRPVRLIITPTASRLALSMNCSAPSGTPSFSAASARIELMARFDFRASEPPRNITAFPDFRQSAAASAVTFGRAS